MAKGVESFLQKYITNKLNLTQIERDKIIETHSYLRTELEDRGLTAYKDEEPYTFLTGSYARSTIIRPPNDIDFFLVLDEQYFEESTERISPKELIKKLVDVLTEIYPEAVVAEKHAEDYEDADIIIQNTSVKVKIDENFGVDIVPAFEENEDFVIPDRKNGVYKKTNPQKHEAIINEANNTTTKTDNKRFKKIIKLVKSWNRDKLECIDLNFKSFHLEVIALDIFESTTIKTLLTGLDTYFESLPQYVRANYLRDPIDDDNFLDSYIADYSDEDVQKVLETIEEAKIAVETAIDLEEEGNINEAINSIGELFSDINLSSIDYKNSKRENYRFKISAKVDTRETGNFTRNYNPSKRKLPKGVFLRFFVDTDIPKPFTLKWRVVNKGEEAKIAGDLRGKIELDNGNYYKNEHTKYKGTHYIEAYALSGSTLMGYDKMFVHIN